MDGRPFRTAITATPDTANEISAYADYWRRIGLEVTEQVLSPTQSRDPQVRAGYPGWGSTAGSSNMIAGPPATAENRWVGGRSGYNNPSFQAMLDTFKNILSESERMQLHKAIGEQIARDVLLIALFYTVEYIGVRKGIRAFQQDHLGRFSAGNVGTYARNAHLWDVE